jgi:hypothetical protein
VLMVSRQFRGNNAATNLTRVSELVVTTHCLLSSLLSSLPPNGEVP